MTSYETWNRTGRRLAVALLAAPVVAMTWTGLATAQSGPPSAPPTGGRDLVAMTFAGTPVGSFPTGLERVDGTMEVVMKDGQPMLRATTRSTFRVNLPEVLPQDFTLEFDLVPKTCCQPEDISFEGTAVINQGNVSANVQWHHEHQMVVGGGPTHSSKVPDDIAVALPGVLTNIVFTVQGDQMTMFTNGQRLYTIQRKFARSRVLRVFLGGQNDTERAVYLARLRVAATTGATTASTGIMTGRSPGTTLGAVPSGFGITVTLGGAGPVVSWSPVPGATAYRASRRKFDDVMCCNTAAPAVASPWQDQPLPMSGTYVYQVIATTPNGDVTAEVQFGYRQPLGPVTTSPTPILVQPTQTATATPITQPTTNPVPPARTGTPTVMSNGPAPTNLSAGGGPVVASISWSEAPGATRYELRRAPAGGTTWTKVAANLAAPPFPATLDVLPDHRQSYTYEVLAYQADGTVGTASVNFTPQPPSDPSGFTATPSGPGAVRLEWDYRGGSPPVLITGPGTGVGVTALGSPDPSGMRSSYLLSGVPAGSHTWTIASNYDPGGVLTASNAWPTATATVAGPDPAPRYRLSVLGFKVDRQSKDINDARDGNGDEVYFAAVVNRTTLTKIPLPVVSAPNASVVMSRSHGDVAVSVPYGRIQAGTASPTGGIRTGDVVPAGLNPNAPVGTPGKGTFPMVLWEGSLGDDDVVVVHPTLWEDDVNPVVQAIWLKTVMEAAAAGYRDNTARQVYSMAFTAPRIYSDPIRATGAQGGSELFECTVIAVNLVRRPCEAHGVDRPIGLSVGTNPMSWWEAVMTLTKGGIERAIGQTWPDASSSGPFTAPGTFVLQLLDQGDPAVSEAIARYYVYFRVERIP